MSEFSFSSLRNELLSSSQAKDNEKIEVNQRHLIDKILARYSAEHTIYREVLQNANDANATFVEIIFKEELFSNDKRAITSIVLRNNGNPFDSNDWNRLKKIAEGNPDDAKIGFFGVGFYSLFSICEEPFVVSGEACLAFYWKGDQLYARSGRTPMDMKSKWTSIYLQLREPLEMPHLDSFAHFIAKSMLFTRFIEDASVVLNDTLLFKVSKRRSTVTDLPVSPNFHLKSLSSNPTKIFSLKHCKMQSMQLELDKRYISQTPKSERSILSALWSLAKSVSKDRQQIILEEEMMNPGKFSIFVHLIDCEAKVNVSSAFSSSMERITKKKPASNIKFSLLYGTFDEKRLSIGSQSNVKHPVLSGVLPDNESGRLFIGFETHQTTGCAVHIAAPFIPTVERESLDFIDKTLSLWNEELIRETSKIIRLIYEIEIQSLSKLFPSGNSDEYWDRATYILRSFGVGMSSPSPLVSHLIVDEFFNCANHPLLFPSSVGVVPATEIRSVPLLVSKFVPEIPALDSFQLKGCDLFINRLLTINPIQPASIPEVVTCLGGKRLEIGEIASCMEWIISLHKEGSLNSRSFYSIVSNLHVPVGKDDPAHQSQSLLAKVTHYPCAQISSNDKLPLPLFCISPSITERIAEYDLSRVFGLRELGLVDFTRFIANESGFLKNPVDAEFFLEFLASSLSKLSKVDLSSVASILSEIDIIPTKNGLKKPRDSYLEDVKIFGDVATVNLKNRHLISDPFLLALGVQSHVDVSLIFSKLDQMRWDHRQLIKYVFKIQDQLSSEELEKLRLAKIFPAIDRKAELFCLHELFLGDKMTLILGLSVLDWKDGQPCPPSSNYAQFLIHLGLRTLVPCDLLLQSISKASLGTRTEIFRYFFDHRNDYVNQYKGKSTDFDFLPTTNHSVLSRPSECYTDEGLEILGFSILHPELKPFSSLLKVDNRPPPKVIARKLIERQWKVQCAAELFSYLSTIAHDFSAPLLQQLSVSDFIPFNNEWYPPNKVFFDKGKFALSNTFVVVDFGMTSRIFLQACGVREEPLPDDIVSTICQNPSRYLNEMGVDSYLGALKWLALQITLLSSNTMTSLRTNRILLGIDYGREEGDIDELAETKYVLASASEIFVIDDTVSQQIFKCLAIPNDPTLETFCLKLGSRHLSKCISTSWQYFGDLGQTNQALTLQQLIHSRGPLLIMEQPAGSKHDRKALENLQNIKVYQAERITISRKFMSNTHDQTTTAFVKSHQQLLVTHPFDFFDLASVLTRIIFSESSRLSDILLISTLLSSPLASLRSKGFPVDRILSKKPIIVDSETEPPDQANIENVKPTPSEPRNIIQAPTNPPISSDVRDDAPEFKPHSSLVGAIKHLFRRKSGHGRGGYHIPDHVDDKELQNTLTESIQSLRIHDKQHIDEPERAVDVGSVTPEARSYCEIIPGQSLFYYGSIGDLSLYMGKNSFNKETAASMIKDNSPQLNSFAILLNDLRSVFKIPKGTMHIFVDPKSHVIAFNRNRTLFFNFCHYQRQVHGGQPQGNTIISWFMTCCHELAHNFIGPHDERHEYYMSSFAEQFLPNLLSFLS